MKAPDSAPQQSIESGADRSALKRYLFAFAMVVLAFLIRKALDPLLQHTPTKHVFLTFIVATTLVAWYSGFVPSVLTFIVGFLLAVFYFLEPRHSFGVSPSDFFQLIVPPILVCVTIILFGRSMHIARERANANASEAINNQKQLEAEVLER